MITFTVLINGKPVSPIFDTGASITCISETVFRNIQLQLINHTSITAPQVTSSSITLGRVCVQLTIGHTTKEVQVHVLRGMKIQLLLGLDNTACFDLKLDLSSGYLKQGDILAIHVQQTLPQTNTKRQQQDVDDSDLSPTQRASLDQLRKHEDIFSKCQTDIGCVSTEINSIALTNNVPIHMAAYRSSRIGHDEIEKQVDALLEGGFIRPSLLPYAAPVIIS